MTELPCDHVRDSLTEYALGIHPAGTGGDVSAHLLACPACRRDVEEIRDLGDQLLDLVPDAEPTLGFDLAVMAKLHPHQSNARRRHHLRPRISRRSRLIAGLAVAAAAAAAVVLPFTMPSGHHQASPVKLTAVLREGTKSIGSVELSGQPLWVYMSVHGESPGGAVTCQLVRRDGTVTTAGMFELINGSGSWGSTIAGASSDVVAARLIDSAGTVVAEASFT
jgi:hypothetical protein